MKARLLLTFIKFIQAGEAVYRTVYIYTPQSPNKLLPCLVSVKHTNFWDEAVKQLQLPQQQW